VNILLNRLIIEILSEDICDAMHEKVPNGENGVISSVVKRTCQGT